MLMFGDFGQFGILIHIVDLFGSLQNMCVALYSDVHGGFMSHGGTQSPCDEETPEEALLMAYLKVPCKQLCVQLIQYYTVLLTVTNTACICMYICIYIYLSYISMYILIVPAFII